MSMWIIALAPLITSHALSFERDLELSLRTTDGSHQAMKERAASVLQRHRRYAAGEDSSNVMLPLANDATSFTLNTRTDEDNYVLHLVWREGGLIRVAELPLPKGESMQVFAPGYRDGKQLVFADGAHSGGNWALPSIRVYERSGPGWRLKQNLVPRQPCEGWEVTFATHRGKADLNRAEAFVRVYPPHLSSPHAGPLLTYRIRFERKNGTFRQTQFERVENAVAALNDLSGWRRAGQRAKFNQLVPPPARESLWDALSRHASINVADDRYEQEAREFVVNGLHVKLAKRDAKWRVMSVAPVPNRVDSGPPPKVSWSTIALGSFETMSSAVSQKSLMSEFRAGIDWP